MILTEHICATVRSADAKALATAGTHGVNVVPVSVIDVVEDSIYLYDFFMHKTIENVSSNASVSLAAWSGLQGVQIKADATYVQSGEVFTAAVSVMQERFPERTLRGVLVLKPTAVYDCSAQANAGQKLSP